MYKKPDFLVVGAAKSGTTSLFHYLKQHPDIYIPEVKECRFFSQLPKDFKGLGAEFFVNEGITDEREYFGLFERYKNRVCGDISNDYLYYYETSIKNIKRYLGDKVKIIIILRNPIDRAYSNFMHSVRDGWEDGSFEEAIIKENKRIKEHWGWSYHYIKVGMYSKQVEYYLSNFRNIKIYLFEELKNRVNFLRDLYQFLGVNYIDNDAHEGVFNISGYPKSRMLQNFLTKENAIKNILKPVVKRLFLKDVLRRIADRIRVANLKKKEMNDYTREYLQSIYRDDIERLSRLINKDLSHWLR